jgi:hypothetical protein
MYILSLRQHLNPSCIISRLTLMTYLKLSVYQPTNELHKRKENTNYKMKFNIKLLHIRHWSSILTEYNRTKEYKSNTHSSVMIAFTGTIKRLKYLKHFRTSLVRIFGIYLHTKFHMRNCSLLSRSILKQNLYFP